MDYQTFIKDLSGRLEIIDREFTDDDNRRLVLKSIWDIGRDVFVFASETGFTSATIAMDSGIPKGTLQKYVRLYRFYPEGYASEIDGKPVSVSHYMAVLYINEKKMRDFYLKEAALAGWSSHELRRRIRNNYYENRAPESQGPGSSGVLGSGGTGVLVQLRAMSQKLFTYSAEVLKVVDGDTLELSIDVGFNTWMRQKIRLRGINCPEITTKKGERAKEFVIEELGFLRASPPEEDVRDPGAPGSGGTCSQGTGTLAAWDAPLVIIRSYKSEKYGRYLADVWYLKGETDREVILAKGKLLNQVLLDNGLAEIVE